LEVMTAHAVSRIGKDIVTCRPIARKRVDKCVSMEMDSWKPDRRCVMDVSLDKDTQYKQKHK
jgi:hypothetical protein